MLRYASRTDDFMCKIIKTLPTDRTSLAMNAGGSFGQNDVMFLSSIPAHNINAARWKVVAVEYEAFA